MATRVSSLSSALSCSALLPLVLRRVSFLQHRRRLAPRRFSAQTIPCGRPPLEVSALARNGLSFQEDDFASSADLCFESPLKIVEYPDPILRAQNKRINTFDDNLKKLVNEMFDIMYKTDGIGLSAPQVGVNVQLMVFNPDGEPGEGEEIVLVNPVVYKASKRTLVYNEGCLSFPSIYADVERPASIKIDGRDITGGKLRVNLTGLSARVFQHEFDHLQGVLFFDRMTDDVVESVHSQLKALEQKYESTAGLPSPENIDKRKKLKQISGFSKSGFGGR